MAGLLRMFFRRSRIGELPTLTWASASGGACWPQPHERSTQHAFLHALHNTHSCTLCRAAQLVARLARATCEPTRSAHHVTHHGGKLVPPTC